MTTNAHFGSLISLELAAQFRGAMGLGAANEPSASISPAPAIETERLAGQNASEPANNNEFSVAAVALAASERGANAVENFALAASETGAVENALAENAGSEYTPADSRTKDFDNRMNEMIFGSIDKALGGQQGKDCSMADVVAPNVGMHQQSCAVGRV